MNFDFTEEQIMFRDTVRKFCRQELPKEYVRWMDDNCDYPPDELWKKMADLGFLGIQTPEEYGGAGLGPIENTILIEEISKVCAAIGLAIFATVGFGTITINAIGTEEQKRKYLLGIASGDLHWAMGLTEPGGGTDILGALRSTAVLDGGDYVINGQKIFITGAHRADYINTIVITDPKAAKKTKALSIFIVDSKSPGLTIRKIKKVSNHSVSACELFFDNVRVPKENLLGTLNKGWYDLLSTLNPERFLCAAMSLGISEAVLEDAIQYSKERFAFGKPIGQFMVIQHMLADMATDIEMTRLLLYKCAWLCDQGRRNEVEAAMVKLVSSDRSVVHACNGMEIFGGYGVCMEYDMQRYLRDSRQFTFAPISNEMCKNFIGESLGLPRSF